MNDDLRIKRAARAAYEDTRKRHPDHVEEPWEETSPEFQLEVIKNARNVIVSFLSEPPSEAMYLAGWDAIWTDDPNPRETSRRLWKEMTAAAKQEIENG